MSLAIPSGFRFYQAPSTPAIALDLTPRLASWDKASHPSQVRLAAFLDHAESRAHQLPALRDAFSLDLDVVLPPGVDVFESGDLDNYIYPLAQRLGGDRLDSAWVAKGRGDGASGLRVDRAIEGPIPKGDDWTVVRVLATGSADTKLWKARIADQVAACAAPAPPGPLEMQIGFRVGPRRAWINLWKPTIDALGAILGLVSPVNPFHPQDGRIVRLGLHRTIAPELTHDVGLIFLWRPARGPFPPG